MREDTGKRCPRATVAHLRGNYKSSGATRKDRERFHAHSNLLVLQRRYSKQTDRATRRRVVGLARVRSNLFSFEWGRMVFGCWVKERCVPICSCFHCGFASGCVLIAVVAL